MSLLVAAARLDLLALAFVAGLAAAARAITRPPRGQHTRETP